MIRRRILILRPDNIGDVVLFSGALQHIRNLYPDAHITLAVQANIVNLVELCPYIDAYGPYEKLTWWGRIKNCKYHFNDSLLKIIVLKLNSLLNIIKSPYDVIIYPVKSPPVAHLELIKILNVKQIYGICGCNVNCPENGYPSGLSPKSIFTDYLDVSREDPWRHELYTTFDFLRNMGCNVETLVDIKPQFWLSDSEQNYLDVVQRSGRIIIGLFPGASFEGKCWEASNYGELAGLLGRRPIYAIFGSPADKELTDRVALSIRERFENGEILNLTGRTTLRELARTIMCCNLFISMDTSGLHIAVAANVPTIGIVGGGHFGRFVPWGDPAKHIFLMHKIECFHCNWQCNKEEVVCIKGVSPHEVAIAAEKLLQSEI